MSEQPGEPQGFSFAGPALFIAVVILVTLFFWWFVRA
jgi:hypothetical protein